MSRGGRSEVSRVSGQTPGKGQCPVGKSALGINLVYPPDNSVTPPLQKHSLPAGPARMDRRGESDPVETAWAPIRGNAEIYLPEDRSLPAPVRLKWEAPSMETSDMLYDVMISRNPDLKDCTVLRNIWEQTCEVYHLHIGKPYYWKVTGRNVNGHVLESPVWSFRTHESTPRWIHVPGITNVRDLGGWPLSRNRFVRQGLIYRSSEMNSHVNITKEGERILTEELGIRTDLDLRGVGEEFGPVLDKSAVMWVNIPIAPYGNITEPTWREGYRRVFRLFAQNENYPILFHCWGGADRGGTVAFLLNALLGVRLPDLIRDYELTSLSIWGERTHASVEFLALRKALMAFSSREDDITEQVENYLHAIGVTKGEITSIRHILIEHA